MKPLSPSELTVFGAICFIAIGLLRVLTWLIKNKFTKNGDEHKPCKAMQKGLCPLHEDFKTLCERIYKLHDVHCGEQAIGEDGIPRWYVTKSERIILQKHEEKERKEKK